MTPNAAVDVRIDLERISRNVERIARETGVQVIAVVKADAYGLGAAEVAPAVADLVDGFYVFDAAEAVRYELFRTTGKRSIALLAESDDPQDYLSHCIHPAVWTRERATILRKAHAVLSIDSGQGRFGCTESAIPEILNTGAISEAFTHAATPKQLAQFQHTVAHTLPTYRSKLRLHASSTALLSNPAARFDAVRIGLAMYAGAVRVSTRLIEVHEGGGEHGYTGFTAPRYGIIRCGYTSGLRVGSCSINGIRQRVLEVGMQTAFVSIGPRDRCGDEVELLSNGLTEADLAPDWRCTPHEVLLRLSGAGVRQYIRH